jgi:hypothetical protein
MAASLLIHNLIPNRQELSFPLLGLQIRWRKPKDVSIRASRRFRTARVRYPATGYHGRASVSTTLYRSPRSTETTYSMIRLR